jgi:hypothetical protein
MELFSLGVLINRAFPWQKNKAERRPAVYSVVTQSLINLAFLVKVIAGWAKFLLA